MVRLATPKTMMDTRYRKVQWGPHGDRLRTSEANWKQPPRWAKAARGSGERPRVFCASLADWLDNKAPQEWRVDLAELIAATPELDWLLLTKRPETYKKLAPWKETPPNVWLGVTGENQEYYDRRWKIKGEETPAAVRFDCMTQVNRLGICHHRLWSLRPTCGCARATPLSAGCRRAGRFNQPESWEV
jgi:protein gp37